MGVEKALDAKADVICIAMGAAMSSKSLDDSLERAKREGVLVVAAAGVADGSADFWPAAHPWAVSCTVSEWGGKGQLEGWGVPCAKAGGYAAHLMDGQRGWGAAELRRLLVLSGPP